MKKFSDQKSSSPLGLEIFQPQPNTLYSLEVTAHLAGVPRRSVLLYCRAGLVHPLFQPPHGVMEFTEEAIYTVRKIEYLRANHTMDLTWFKMMIDLRDELDHLRAEIRFLRNR
ncbi:MAG: hypothetical protein V4507_13200 [Verrucomicrobiota bacterium]